MVMGLAHADMQSSNVLSAEYAIKPLEKAASALPKAEKVWICLLVAHYRCGNHSRVKEVLAIMRQRGFDEQELHKIEHDLTQPPQTELRRCESL
jgi:hypothetical protein